MATVKRSKSLKHAASFRQINRVYVESERFGRDWLPIGLVSHPTSDDLKSKRGTERRVIAQNFRPADNDRRFVVVEGEWDSSRDPRSLVDVSNGELTAAYWLADSDKLTREAGLKAVAEANGEALRQSIASGCGADGCRWAALVELGHTPCHVEAIIEVHAGDVGVARTYQDVPVRLVRPTAEERGRFPSPADVADVG